MVVKEGPDVTAPHTTKNKDPLNAGEPEAWDQGVERENEFYYRCEQIIIPNG